MLVLLALLTEKSYRYFGHLSVTKLFHCHRKSRVLFQKEEGVLVRHKLLLFNSKGLSHPYELCRIY